MTCWNHVNGQKHKQLMCGYWHQCGTWPVNMDAKFSRLFTSCCALGDWKSFRFWRLIISSVMSGSSCQKCRYDFEPIAQLQKQWSSIRPLCDLWAMIALLFVINVNFRHWLMQMPMISTTSCSCSTAFFHCHSTLCFTLPDAFILLWYCNMNVHRAK